MARRKTYNREPMPKSLCGDKDGIERWEIRQRLRRRGIEKPTENQVTREIQKRARGQLE